MKKFEFSLSKMHHYKEQILEEEKNTLAQLTHRKHTIELAIEEIDRSFAATSYKMLSEQERGIPASQLRIYNNHLTDLRNQRKEQEKALKKAEEEVDRQMEKVVEANREVSKLDKLEEKQYEEYQKLVAKAEEALIEEFVSSDSIRKRIS